MIKVRLDPQRCKHLNELIGCGIWVGVFMGAVVFIWVAAKFGYVPGLTLGLFKRTAPLLLAEMLLGWLFYAGFILKPR